MATPTTGDDILDGTSDPDTIDALAGNDVVNGLGGDDSLSGGDDNDTLEGGAGNNTLDGGNGIDTVSYASAPVDPVVTNGGVNVDLSSNIGSAGGYDNNTDTITNIENVIGSAFDDVISGDGSNNRLDGGGGDDFLDGGAGDDTLIGGTGNDTVYFSGTPSDYTFQSLGGGVYRFFHSGGAGQDGTDDLSGIETLSFSGTEISFADFIACFLRGTRILTRAGYVPVESLKPGDEVRTLNHGWRPLQWLGQRHIARNATGGFDHEVQPIRIVRDAFGAGMPSRDLWVSPNHAAYFRDHLIPAKALVNGETVIRDASVDSITYYHVLLDRHAVVFSDGLPTESYSPQENVDQFENAASCPEPWRNSDIVPIGMLTDCHPRAASGPMVETARAFLTRMAAGSATARTQAGRTVLG
ncbi:Hint domain-containing protein [Methylomagnum sp.]